MYNKFKLGLGPSLAKSCFSQDLCSIQSNTTKNPELNQKSNKKSGKLCDRTAFKW